MERVSKYFAMIHTVQNLVFFHSECSLAKGFRFSPDGFLFAFLYRYLPTASNLEVSDRSSSLFELYVLLTLADLQLSVWSGCSSLPMEQPFLVLIKSHILVTASTGNVHMDDFQCK